jgi:hypothetical protein
MPGPAGSGRAQILPRWPVPVSHRRIVNDRTERDRDEQLLYTYYPTEPGDSFGKSYSFFQLAIAQPLSILSRPGLTAIGSRRASGMANGRNPWALFPRLSILKDLACD